MDQQTANPSMEPAPPVAAPKSGSRRAARSGRDASRKLLLIGVAVLAALVAMSMLMSAVGGPVVATLVFGIVVALLVARAWDKRQLRRLQAKMAKATAPAPPRRSVLYLSPVHRAACGASFAVLGMLACFAMKQPWGVGLVVGLFVGLLFDYVLRVALVLIVLGLVYLAVVYVVLPWVQ